MGGPAHSSSRTATPAVRSSASRSRSGRRVRLAGQPEVGARVPVGDVHVRTSRSSIAACDRGQRLLAVDQHLDPVARAHPRVHVALVAVGLEHVAPAELAQSALVVGAQQVFEPSPTRSSTLSTNARTFPPLIHTPGSGRPPPTAVRRVACVDRPRQADVLGVGPRQRGRRRGAGAGRQARRAVVPHLLRQHQAAVGRGGDGASGGPGPRLGSPASSSYSPRSPAKIGHRRPYVAWSASARSRSTGRRRPVRRSRRS